MRRLQLSRSRRRRDDVAGAVLLWRLEWVRRRSGEAASDISSLRRGRYDATGLFLPARGLVGA